MCVSLVQCALEPRPSCEHDDNQCKNLVNQLRLSPDKLTQDTQSEDMDFVTEYVHRYQNKVIDKSARRWQRGERNKDERCGWNYKVWPIGISRPRRPADSLQLQQTCQNHREQTLKMKFKQKPTGYKASGYISIHINELKSWLPVLPTYVVDVEDLVKNRGGPDRMDRRNPN